jgi:hypothetical protein
VQRRLVALAVACVALYAVSSWAQTKPADPWVGTWKTDLAKSKYSPGPTPKTPGTVTIEPSGTGMKTTIDGPDLQGKPMHTETVWTFDGKDHPVKGAAAPNTTAAYKRVNDHTFEVTTKIDGKPTVTTRVVVSADAKTLTATQTGKSADGSAVNNVIVASKQ